MRVRRGLVVGSIACLLFPGLIAVLLSVAMDASADIQPVTIPTGHIGDRVEYSGVRTVSDETGTREETFRLVFEVRGAGTAVDRWGMEHSTILVAEAREPPLPFPNEVDPPLQRISYIDVDGRDVVQLESQFIAEGAPGVPAEAQVARLETKTFYDPQPSMGPAWSNHSLFRHQGNTYEQSAGPLNPERVCQRPTIFGSATLHGISSGVASYGTIDGRAAAEFATQGEFSYQTTSSRSPTVERFSENAVLSDGSAYPLQWTRTTETTSETGLVSTTETMTLAAFEPGTDPIPWQLDAAEGCPDAPHVDLERQDRPFPVQGGAPLRFPLEEAISAGESSPPFLLWRQTHDPSYLVSLLYFEVAEDPRDWYAWPPRADQWMIAYWSNADLLVLSVERDPIGGPIRTIQFPSGNPDAEQIVSFNPEDLPQNPVTMERGIDLWLKAALPESKARGVTRIGWGLVDVDWSNYSCDEKGYCAGQLNVQGKNAFQTLSVGYSAGVNFGFVSPGVYDTVHVDLQTGLLQYHRVMRTFTPLTEQEALAAAPPMIGMQTTNFSAGSSDTFAYAAGAAATLLAAFLLAYFIPVIKYVLTSSWAGYAKIEAGDILEHKLRETIAAAVEQEPGISPPQLQHRMDIAWSTLVYHLRVLERNKVVSSLIDGRHKRFFTTGKVDWNRREAIAVLRDPTSKRVLEAVRQTPNGIQSRLAEAVGISPQALVRHIRRLERSGLIRREQKGRAMVIRAVDAAPPESAS